MADAPQTTPADIVERLRDARYMHPPRSMLEEAAKEIERLRARVEFLEIDALNAPGAGLCAALRRMEAEDGD